MSVRLVLPLLCALSLPALADQSHHAFGKPAKAADADRTVEITLGDMYYEPDSVQVKAGETVRFVLKNEGALLHEFSLGNAAMHAEHQKHMLMMQQMGMLTPTVMQRGKMTHDDPNTVMLEPGQSAELTWTFAQATGLEFACNIPGHYQAGMVGNVEVQP